MLWYLQYFCDSLGCFTVVAKSVLGSCVPMLLFDPILRVDKAGMLLVDSDVHI